MAVCRIQGINVPAVIRKLRFGSIEACASPIDELCRKRSSALGALPSPLSGAPAALSGASPAAPAAVGAPARSEEHTSELQSLMRISYAVFCLKKKTKNTAKQYTHDIT